MSPSTLWAVTQRGAGEPAQDLERADSLARVGRVRQRLVDDEHPHGALPAGEGSLTMQARTFPFASGAIRSTRWKRSASSPEKIASSRSRSVSTWAGAN